MAEARGTTQYDPDAGGFVGDEHAPGNYYPFDTGLSGNHRLGHEYGTAADPRGLPTLTEQQRDAVVEYMKTL